MTHQLLFEIERHTGILQVGTERITQAVGYKALSFILIFILQDK